MMIVFRRRIVDEQKRRLVEKDDTRSPEAAKWAYADTVAVTVLVGVMLSVYSFVELSFIFSE